MQMGQLVGPFGSHEELCDKIINNTILGTSYIKHLGIQAKEGTIVYINNKSFEIGKTGIYEITNCKINSIYFKDDVDHHYIIDYVI